MKFSLLALSCILVSICAPAKADIIRTFTVDGTFSTGSSFDHGSTIDINTTAGIFTHADIFLAGTEYAILFDPGFLPSPDFKSAFIVAGSLGSGAFLRLDVPGATLVGYAGGALLPTQSFASVGGTLVSGSFIPVPEAPTVVPLCFGLTGLTTLMIKRQKASAQASPL